MSRRYLTLAALGTLAAMAYRNAEPGEDGGVKTAEQLAAESAGADQAAAQRAEAEKATAAAAAAEKKALEKKAKDEKKAADKAEKETKIAAEKEAKAQAKTLAAQQKQADKDAKEKAAADKKAAAEAAKASQKLPEQNGVVRPKPNTVTGSVWTAADSISKQKGAPAAIGEVVLALPLVADATVKTQYARWRKFNGVSGRVAPIQATTAATPVGIDPSTGGTANVPVPPVPTPA